jgi:hypothetical protein
MPPRKKAKEEPRREEARPSVAEPDGVENPFAQLAQKHWTSKKSAKVKVKPDVLKNEIWDVLEKESFAFKSLLLLENLQILEKYGCSLNIWRIANCSNSYLWPGYSEDSSNFHVLLIALITNVKTREHLPTWGKSFAPDTGLLLTVSRPVYGQCHRVLLSISTNSFDDIRYNIMSHRPNPPSFVYNQRFPVVGQRYSQEGMRSFGIHIYLAQFIEREEAGTQVGSECASAEGLEGGSKT